MRDLEVRSDVANVYVANIIRNMHVNRQNIKSNESRAQTHYSSININTKYAWDEFRKNTL